MNPTTLRTHTAQGAQFTRPVENFRYDNKQLESRDPNTDEVVWSTPLSSQPKGCLAVTEDSVALITLGGGERITCLDRSNGEVRWSRPFMGQTMMNSAYATPQGNILTFDNNDLSLHSFDAQSGNRAWKAGIGDYLKGVPTGPAGIVLVQQLSGKTVQLDEASGDRIRA